MDKRDTKRIVKEIPLTQGQVAFVDDEWFECLNQWRWHAQKDYKNGKFYARRNSGYIKGIKRVKIWMHRVVIGDNDGARIDHKDGNGCNNQKDNLRSVSHPENMSNRGKNRNNTSGFKGVFWHIGKCTWEAKIGFHGKLINLGSFKSKKDAVIARNIAALHYHGEFAHQDSVPS